MRIAPPAGVLETDNRGASSTNSSDRDEFAAGARVTLRLTLPNPALLAETVCCPGAIPVKVHGLSQRTLPSNEICAPGGFEETESCAGAALGTERVRDFLL